MINDEIFVLFINIYGVLSQLYSLKSNRKELNLFDSETHFFANQINPKNYLRKLFYISSRDSSNQDSFVLY